MRYKGGEPASGLGIVVDRRLLVKTTSLGEYWKLLKPGEYSLKVSLSNSVLLLSLLLGIARDEVLS